jgi:hypothetical protein
MTPTENASEASGKRALWRVERHARRGEWISIDLTISMFRHFWNIEAICNKI